MPALRARTPLTLPQPFPPHDQPEMRTARLRLYPPRLDDLDARLAMDREPEVMRYVSPVPEDTAEHRALIRRRILGLTRPGAFWHVEEAARPAFLGWCGLFDLEDSGLIEIGYRYVRAAWGRGIATEAARAVLDHGFRVLALDPIVAVAHPENTASQRVLEKIGLRRAGTAHYYGQAVAFFRLARADYTRADYRPSTSRME